MLVKKRMYAITTKDRPIQFLTERAELSQSFEDAALYETADYEISTLDEPDKFMPVEVEITADI
jgi:hypothetical protein